MSVLIAYTSKMGTTKECACKLANLFQCETKVVNLEAESHFNISDYDKVIIGSPVYMGRVSAKVLQFCKNNIEILLEKKIGIYVCCLGMLGKGKKYMEQFPETLQKIAVVKEDFGGRIDMETVSENEKKMLLMIGLKKDICNIEDDKLQSFQKFMDIA